MDAHFLLDIFTLCSVASLICVLILYKAITKRRLNQSHQTRGTQTANQVLNLDESINRLSSELTPLHARLEHLEQERLQDVTKNEHCPAESEEPNHVQSIWRAADVPFLLNDDQDAFQSIYSTLSVIFCHLSCGEGLALSKLNILLLIEKSRTQSDRHSVADKASQ